MKDHGRGWAEAEMELFACLLYEYVFLNNFPKYARCISLSPPTGPQLSTLTPPPLIQSTLSAYCMISTPKGSKSITMKNSDNFFAPRKFIFLETLTISLVWTVLNAMEKTKMR